MTNYCTCCERKLHPEREVWLEFHTRKCTYHRPGDVPAEDSQGCFPFGPGCAKRVLNNGGTILRKAA